MLSVFNKFTDQRIVGVILSYQQLIKFVHDDLFYRWVTIECGLSLLCLDEEV